MAYLTNEKLIELGLKYVGKNVKISDKAAIYNPESIEIGDNSRIDDFCIISGKIKIGKYVHIAPHCLVAGGEEGITMNDFSGLAYFVQVFSQSDDYSGKSLTNPTVPKEYKNEYKSPVYIGRHVIIGASSIVFPSVSIADGCSIGAMTLVNKSTLPWGIYLGNPARRIRDRSQDLLLMEEKLMSTT